MTIAVAFVGGAIVGAWIGAAIWLIVLRRRKGPSCPVCGGSGEFSVGDETGVCGFCHGERKVSEEEKGE